MEVKNQYADYYKRLSLSELKEISTQPKQYQDEARLAAYQELENREHVLLPEQKIAFKELEQNFKAIQEEIKSSEKIENNTIMREWYSPSSILGFTLFFSVIFGAVLLAYNLRQENKKKESVYAIVLSVCISILGVALYKLLKTNQWIILLSNVIGGFVLIEFFWKKYLGVSTQYIRKSIWKAVVISISISVIATIILIKQTGGM